MNKEKLYTGLFMFIVGIILFFIEQTKNVAAYPFGFGLGIVAAGLNN